MIAHVFPGQGSQFSGMGKELYENSELARKYFHSANEILGFDIAKIMFEGTEEELKQTSVTQPAIFLHSVIDAFVNDYSRPDAVAGHSLGEFSALVAAKALSFEDGLKLVKVRAEAMQLACNNQASSMAAILGVEDALIEEICSSIENEIVVAANYNTIGQVVISGTENGIDKAIEKLKEAGAKRALKLNVNGAFHSPLMKSAEEALAKKINDTLFNQPLCPVYQNFTAQPSTEIQVIKDNLIRQLTGPVRWTQTIKNMQINGIENFIEIGPGKVLTGLIRKTLG
jgi:[acyl-carrier-protein] S-malonyltransferase